MGKVAEFMQTMSTKPKLKQCEIARELNLSSSTLQRYGREMNMPSPYGIPPSSNTHTTKQTSSNYTEHDLKLTSNHVKMTSEDAV